MGKWFSSRLNGSLLLLLFLFVSCINQSDVHPVLTSISLTPTETTKTQTVTAGLVPPSPTEIPSDTPRPSQTLTPAPILLVGAGDIAYCGEDHLGDEQTAAIIAGIPDALVFTAGDNVDGYGTQAEYKNCYGPSWGQFKSRTRPSPGNHDYLTDGGNPYFAYFGESAGEVGTGYYSFDLGDWHIAALNSNCDAIACGPNSKQAAWLNEDLATSDKHCSLLYWHHPRWSSGLAGNYGSVNTFWRVAVEMGVEVIVNGNDHGYERFSSQGVDGQVATFGVREFVVGTGGSQLREFGETKANSEVRYNQTHGVILFKLFDNRFEWEFIPVSGDFRDQGSANCH